MSSFDDKPTSITYEQPVNEQIRICLRLEYLFEQLTEHQQGQTEQSAKSALIALARLTEVIDRPDLKSKMTQMLTQHASTLAQLQQFNQVDPLKLAQLLSQLDNLIDYLHRVEGKIGAALRQNEFLNQVRQQVNSPWGICHYNSPAVALWLRNNPEQRSQDLHRWSDTLTALAEMSALILRLTRHSTDPQTVTASGGLYQQTLNPSLPCHLIRITLPASSQLYPEVSVSKHRVIIRLLQPDYAQGCRAKQCQQDVSFALNCCRL